MQFSWMIFIFLNGGGLINGAKILFYAPQIGDSHSTFLGSIADALVDAGHDVLFYAPNIDPRLTVIGTEKARILHMPQPFELPADDFNEYQKRIWVDKSSDLLQAYRLMRRITVNSEVYCEAQLNNAEIMTALQAEKFDLGIAETLDPCGFGLFQLLGIERTIAASAISVPLHLAYLMGLPSPPSFVTDAIIGKLGTRPTFLERCENVINNAMSVFMQIQSIERVTDLFRRKFATNFESIKHKLAKVDLVFVNMNELVDFPRPLTPKFVFVSGIGIRQAKPLNNEYTSILSNNTGGIVLVSFGTMIESRRMPDSIKKIILRAFARFPSVTFIWKYEGDGGIANATANVVFKKRIPQVDLLADSRIVGFINHGGLNGMMEAMHAAVPSIVIPIFGDQMRNALMGERHGVVKIVRRVDLNEENLHGAIDAVLHRNSIRQAVQRLRSVIMDRPGTAKERVLNYTEFLLKHGPLEQLSCEGRHLSFFLYFSLDVLCFVLILCTMLVLFFFTLRCLYHKMMSVQKTKNE